MIGIEGRGRREGRQEKEEGRRPDGILIRAEF